MTPNTFNDPFNLGNETRFKYLPDNVVLLELFEIVESQRQTSGKM